MKLPSKVGPYKLNFEKRWEGTYGIVVRGIHEDFPKRKSVVKLIPLARLITSHRKAKRPDGGAALPDLTPQEADEAAFRYVMDEANRAEELKHHANVVDVHDVGVLEKERLGWIAMEFVSGGNLQDRRKSTLPLNESLRYIEEIADGVTWIHAHRMVHGDLKEENILLAPAFDDPDYYTAKITDFSVLRSFSWRPVGQKKRKRMDVLAARAADIKAMAEIAYRLITGKDVPKKPNSWFSERIWQKLPRARQLQWVIRSGLEAPTTLAYSAAQFRNGIQAYRTVNIPPGYPASRVERVSTLYRRRSVAAPIVTGVAFAFFMATVLVVSLYVKTQVQEANAKELIEDNQRKIQELDEIKRESLETLRKTDMQTVQRTFETLRLHRHTKAQAAVPPAQMEPVERALADRVREIEKKLSSLPWKEEALPWLDLCKAQLALIKGDYKGVVDILPVDPPKQAAPDPLESERVYFFYDLRGAGHFGRGDFAAAAKDFAKAVDAMPNNVFAWANLGRAQVEARNLAEGIRTLTKTKKLLFARPKQARTEEWKVEPTVLFALGHAFMFQKQPEKAIASLTEAVAYWDNPDRPHDGLFADCNIELAVAYGRLQKHNEAQIHADKAVSTYRDLRRIAPLPQAVKVNYAIALYTSVSARVSKYDVHAVLPDATEAIDILDELHENTLLAKARLIRSSAHFQQCEYKIRSVRASNILFDGIDGVATFSPAHWLTANVGVEALLPAMCADAIADAKHAAKLSHDAGDIAEEAKARVQLVADYALCGDRPKALTEVRITIPLIEKTGNAPLLAKLRQMEQQLQRELKR